MLIHRVRISKGFRSLMLSLAALAGGPVLLALEAHGSLTHISHHDDRRGSDIRISFSLQQLARLKSELTKGNEENYGSEFAQQTFEKALIQYVTKHLKLYSKSEIERRIIPTFIGIDYGYQSCDVLFKVPNVKPGQLIVRNELFFDFYPKQINTVTLEDGYFKEVLVFHASSETSL